MHVDVRRPCALPGACPATVGVQKLPTMKYHIPCKRRLNAQETERIQQLVNQLDGELMRRRDAFAKQLDRREGTRQQLATYDQKLRTARAYDQKSKATARSPPAQRTKICAC